MFFSKIDAYQFRVLLAVGELGRDHKLLCLGPGVHPWDANHKQQFQHSMLPMLTLILTSLFACLSQSVVTVSSSVGLVA